MEHQQYLYLKLLLLKNLQLDLDEFALTNTRQQGLVCSFMEMNLSSVFQPVVRANGKVVGHKALLRASISDYGLTPEDAFDHAEELRRLVQFDRLVRTIHLLNHARSFAEDELLFLNVHPRLLASISDHGRTFEQILHYYSVPTSRVVIEINESAVEDEVCLKEAMYNYRSLGYKVALSNLGAAYPSLDRVVDSFGKMLNLRPDIAKLDVRLVDMVDGLANIFDSASAQVIITGIETPEQLDIARNAGADLLQGYYLGRPEFSADARGQLCRSERLAA